MISARGAAGQAPARGRLDSQNPLRHRPDQRVHDDESPQTRHETSPHHAEAAGQLLHLTRGKRLDDIAHAEDEEARSAAPVGLSGRTPTVTIMPTHFVDHDGTGIDLPEVRFGRRRRPHAEQR